LLGDDVFKKCLQEYLNRWHGKHPLPWDFFNTVNNASAKDLNWFWQNWFFSHNHIDLALRGATKSSNGYSLSIRNVGGMAAPFDVVVGYADGTTDRIHETPAVWEKDQKQATVDIPVKKEVQSLKLEGGIFMDANEADNTWKAK